MYPEVQQEVSSELGRLIKEVNETSYFRIELNGEHLEIDGSLKYKPQRDIPKREHYSLLTDLADQLSSLTINKLTIISLPHDISEFIPSTIKQLRCLTINFKYNPILKSDSLIIADILENNKKLEEINIFSSGNLRSADYNFLNVLSNGFPRLKKLSISGTDLVSFAPEIIKVIELDQVEELLLGSDVSEYYLDLIFKIKNSKRWDLTDPDNLEHLEEVTREVKQYDYQAQLLIEQLNKLCNLRKLTLDYNFLIRKYFRIDNDKIPEVDVILRFSLAKEIIIDQDIEHLRNKKNIKTVELNLDDYGEQFIRLITYLMKSKDFKTIILTKKVAGLEEYLG